MHLYSGNMVSTPFGTGIITKVVVYEPYKSRFIEVNVNGVKHKIRSKTFDYWDLDGVEVLLEEENKHEEYLSPREKLQDVFDSLNHDKIEKLIDFLENL